METLLNQDEKAPEDEAEKEEEGLHGLYQLKQIQEKSEKFLNVKTMRWLICRPSDNDPISRMDRSNDSAPSRIYDEP